MSPADEPTMYHRCGLVADSNPSSRSAPLGQTGHVAAHKDRHSNGHPWLGLARPTRHPSPASISVEPRIPDSWEQHLQPNATTLLSAAGPCLDRLRKH